MSNSFFQIPDESLTIEEFCERYADDKDTQFIEYYFKRISKLLYDFNALNGAQVRVPKFKIRISESIGAEGIANVIYINLGLIKHLISLGAFDPFFIDKGINRNKLRMQLIFNSFDWIIFHEIYHTKNKHNSISEKHGGSDNVDMALEYDADLNAIATIYRLNQLNFEKTNLPDLDIRKFVIFSIFWFIRTMQPLGHSEGHPPIEERIFHMTSKLAVLAENFGDRPDLEFKLSSSKNNINELFRLVYICESMVKNDNSPVKAEGDLIKAFESVSQTLNKNEMLSAYEIVRPDIEEGIEKSTILLKILDALYGIKK